ncbi:MAG: hypothetical protein ACP5E5_10410 [Acidobacteriaceae bacterium]
MEASSISAVQRRDFLKLLGAATAFSFADDAFASGSRRIDIVIDAEDPVAWSVPVRWAAEQLRQAIAAQGATARIVHPETDIQSAAWVVVVTGPESKMGKRFSHADASLQKAEGIRLAPDRWGETPVTLVCGSDRRGCVYGLLELLERVQFSHDPYAALRLDRPVVEQPANKVRSVARAFCSDIEDKAWYYDRSFWRGYLDMLAASRFNRFNLAFGFGYDFPTGVTGDYFHFPYPYLVDVPGYDVRVVRLASPEGKELSAPVPLAAEERERNFEMLRFVAHETAARGLEFQMGIWNHAYQWTDSPHAHHRIEGLTPQTHAAYCRDALAMILKACPEIKGLTLRVHGESGIPEGSYSFWSTLFEAICGSGRKIEIDMHAKGVNSRMIDTAAHTGMPVKLSAKYSAEHQGLGYQQADIRKQEIPQAGHVGNADLFSVSTGARLFTRYGYADFFQQGARYELFFRLWPGTQRHLLSADPEMAAAFGRSSHFCGAAGLEVCEPLTFKGREGSGLPGGRCAYADESLNPEYDWQKFAYSYRVWGRRLYDPDADPESWRRYLRRDFGPGTNSVEAAVANASRVLPLVTSAHLPSASNHAFWPEIYTNMPIVPGSEPSPYGDTPTPKLFGTVSPLDPQLFSTIDEHTADLLAGRPNAKYSPIEVAQWLEEFTAASAAALASARVKAPFDGSPEFRRMEEDVIIQNAVGRFFAAKLRSAVLFQIYQQTGYPKAGQLALDEYNKAREGWAAMSERANSVYRADITYGRVPMRRGNWSARLAGIDRDVAAMREKIRGEGAANVAEGKVEKAVRAAVGRPVRPSIPCSHTPPQAFRPGQPLSLSLALADGTAYGVSVPSEVNLRYRHVNQAERWRSIKMERRGQRYVSSLPGEYTDSPYPLQYYFELQRGMDAAWLYPAFNSTLSNQPYYAIFHRI